MWRTTIPALIALSLSSAANAETLAAIPDAACAVDEGRLVCWGQVASLFGRPTTADTPADPPVRIPGLRGVTDVDLAPGHACATRADGRVVCFGTNHSGELGSGNYRAGGRRVVRGVEGATRVAVGGPTDHKGGYGFACALSEGSVSCWGANQAGQLGRSGLDRSALPVEVKLGGEIVDLEAGDDFVCARGRYGDVRCWGAGDFRPRLLSVASTSFDARGEQLCVVDDEVRCGPLSALKSTPLPRGEVTLGVDHVCVRADEGVTCSGNNWGGALGLNGQPADELAAGLQFTCARTGDQVRCWGNNYTGALGTPPEADEPRARPALLVKLKPSQRL